jgi:hypothetical protein
MNIQMFFNLFNIKNRGQLSALFRKLYILNNTTKKMKPAWPGAWYRLENADTLIDR